MSTLHESLSRMELEDMRNYLRSSKNLENLSVHENYQDREVPDEHKVSIFHFYENETLMRTFIFAGEYIYLVRKILDECFEEKEY